MPVTLRSHSKINLGLAIGPTQPDGFHSLVTLYQTMEAHDLVTVRVARLHAPTTDMTRRIELTSNDRRVPLDARNTVWKMLALALHRPDREHLRVKVHINKRLPVQGGLGGGSANAAAALLGLERELARRSYAAALTGEERLRFAAEVGSDVPLFLLGGTVLGYGRGEQVVPLADLATMPAVIALPKEGVSTPAAFRAFDAAQAARGLTPESMTGRLVKLSRALASAWCEQHATGVLIPETALWSASQNQDLAGTLLSSLVQTGILLNDFEEVVFRQHPFLEQIKRVFVGHSTGEHAMYAALSGSGSAVFGLYSDEAVAARAAEQLNGLGLGSLRTHTLGRREYWAGMVVSEE